MAFKLIIRGAPWRVDEVVEGSLRCIEVVEQDGRTIVCTVGENCVGGQQPETDHARLIAAAPKLYAACKEVAECLIDSIYPWPEDLSQVHHKLEAALAEADGKE